MSVIANTSSGWQAGFLAVLPAVEVHARIKFRKLPVSSREDSIQEAIAAACVNYQLMAARSNLQVVRPGTLSDFAVRHVRTGRHVGGMQDAAKDVLSPVARDRHGVRVRSYDSARSTDGTDGWRQMALAGRKVDIPGLAAFRIDFDQWLRTLTRRDRGIVNALSSGERSSAVADRFGISRGRVSQLRRRYEREWLVFQGETIASQAA